MKISGCCHERDFDGIESVRGYGWFVANICKVNRLAEELGAVDGFLNRYAEDVFDILTVCATKKEQLNYTDVPPVLRPHWSR